ASFNIMANVILDNVQTSDSSAPSMAAVVLNANYVYADFLLRNVYNGVNGSAIQMTAGTMHSCSLQGSGLSNHSLVNASGDVIGGCAMSNNYGFDLVDAPGDTGIATKFHNTKMTCQNGVFGCNESSTPIRMTDNGDSYALLGIDAIGGLEMGPPQVPSGYDVELYRLSTQKAAIRIAQAQAPLSLKASTTAGGALTIGKSFYYFVETTMAANSCSPNNLTGPSKEVFATSVEGGHAIKLSWAKAVGSEPAGYCIWRGSKSGGENAYKFVTGVSFLDRGTSEFTGGTPSEVNQTYPKTPQFIFELTALTLPGITDTELSPSAAVCTDASKRLTTTNCPNGTRSDGGSAGRAGVFKDGNAAPPFVNSPTEERLPAAVNNTGSVQTGWSIGPPCGIAPSLLSRSGRNLLAGYLQFTAGRSACTQIEIPGDWDRSANPYLRIHYTQQDSTAGQIIAYLVQTACSDSTDDPRYESPQYFAVTNTSNQADVPYTNTLQLNPTSMSHCASGNIMNLRISTTSSTNATSNFQILTIIWPRQIPVQAN
ncbi:MAG: hypothetical protein WCD27_15880, partial [Candidatus Acidiferrales bacterium]